MAASVDSEASDQVSIEFSIKLNAPTTTSAKQSLLELHHT